MAKPIPDINLRVLSKNDEVKSLEDSVIDSTINRINKKKSSRDLVLGTFSGWLIGVGSYKVGKIAAFGIGGSVILLHFASEFGYVDINWDRIRETLNNSEELVDNVVQFVKKNSCFSVGFVGGFFFDDSSAPVSTVTPAGEDEAQTAKKQLPIEPIPIKPADSFKNTEEPVQPTYAQSKPISHSPKISPSSIPNPNPSVISTKQTESSYSSVGGYPFSIPGYSAFQPVSHANVIVSSSPSVQPVVLPLNKVKSNSNYAPYCNTNASDTTTALAALLPVSSIPCTSQGSTLHCIPLITTFSSAPPVTTAASIKSISPITPVLTIPPSSAIAPESSLPTLMGQSKSVESLQSTSLVQSASLMLRTSLGPSTSSTLTLEPLMEGVSPSVETTTSKPIIKGVPSAHSRIQSDGLMQQMTLEDPMSSMVPITSDALLQRMPLEHSIQSVSTLTSDFSNQKTPVTTSSTLPSVAPPPIQMSMSTLPVMHQMLVEHSMQPITPLESSITRDMSSTPMMSSESVQRIPIEHSISSISSEASLQRTMTLNRSVLLEPSKQHIPLEHSMPTIPNIPSDLSMQRMPLEYYMPSLSMMPSELLMRRMQLLQYMQSLQPMTSEQSAALLPPYAVSMPQAQATTTAQTVSLEQSVLAKSTIPSDITVPHKQSVQSTISIPSQSMAPVQVALGVQSIPSVSTKTESVTASITQMRLVPSTSSIKLMSEAQHVASVPVEGPRENSALTSYQSVPSILTTTSNSPISSTQRMPSQILMSNNVDQSNPPITLQRAMPLLSVMVSDQSLASTARMQVVQSMPSALVQSMPYELAKSSYSSIQQTQLEQTNEQNSSFESVSSVETRSIMGVAQSIPLITFTDKPLITLPSTQTTRQLQSMSVPQPSVSSISSEKSIETLPYKHTSVSSDSAIQHMHFVHPLQSISTVESDKLMLKTKTAVSLETTMPQKPLVVSTQSVSFTPSKFSATSIPYGHTSNLKINLSQPLPSVSTISTALTLASIPHIPLTQSMPQSSTMTSNSSTEVTQSVKFPHIPFMSIVSSETNPVLNKELIPPLSLVQSMSTMTLAPLTSVQPASSLESVPSVSASFQMMASGQFMRTKHFEVTAPNAPSELINPQLVSNENDKQISDKCSDISQTEISTNVEDHYTPEIKSAAPTSENIKCIMTQRSQHTTIPVSSQTISKETKRKPFERFSLKTSIPISKIDMKSVPNPPDVAFQNPLVKKLSFNALKINNGQIMEKQIQRNLIIRNTGRESEGEEYQSMISPTHINLTTLINATETINVNDKQFRNFEPKVESKETIQLNNTSSTRNVSANSKEGNKLGFKSNSSDASVSDQNNQIVFIQNKNCTNKKMILTIQQQSPQVLLKRKNVEKTSLRFSNQLKKCKEESVTITEHIPSKVVALKRLHQSDCDEDDFENLITENQIYGNKIVVKEKMQGTSQEQDLKLKNNKTNRPIQSPIKNVVKPPSFVYLSNVKYPTNIMMYKNSLKSNTDFNKDNKITPNENKITELKSSLSKSSDSVIKPITLQSVPISKENSILNDSNNLLQIPLNKINQTDMAMPKISQKVLIGPKILQQIPKIVDTKKEIIESAANSEKTALEFNRILQKPIEQYKVIDRAISNAFPAMESNFQIRSNTDTIISTNQAEEEVSSLDIYEKRKRLRRVKYLSNRGMKDVQKSESKKLPNNGRYIITPEKIKAEIYKEFASTRIIIGDEGGDFESEYEDELEEYESLIKFFGPTKKMDSGKTEFLSNFMLGTEDTCKEIIWNKRERMIQRDKIAAAYIAAGRLDRLLNEDTPKEIETKSDSINSEPVTLGDINDNGTGLRLKRMFLSHLNLKHVKPQHKAGYETTWQEILKERKRRNAPEQYNHVFKQPRLQIEKVEINTNCELQILTEIKNSVTENNNLIKKRLDLSCQDEGDSIKTLAEKNFSELDRLSKMADRSVKHYSGQDTRKRDLNPGFDSANIQNPVPNLGQPINFPNINIPNISKIISLKTTSEPYTGMSSQATSMDEPQNSAAGVDEMFSEANIDKTKDAVCQTEKASWPGVEEMIKMYKDVEKARKKEIIELTRRNTALKVEGAHITRNASRHSDRARALLAERRNLSLEEGAMKQAIQRLFNAVDIVRNYF